ncbi:hypothetical protein KSC_023270 [Ktedonobacter sp. SOSP1-52]|uniref:hypothetical protein n=1 Tax=Ktedonobacter sp. SOSP1-52 TaxID=2778366 RepID=UPI0019169044|nr:hypothetical protein [Ktedonobacter sp. SOSP1-52]GHO63435.1 hypothetical protein KSC_023270 [Ktedonobacter sp. SOSP1-52]
MTPKHQEIIDATLQAMYARERRYHHVLSLPPEEPFRTRSIEELRASLLGQKLCWIAEYVEGYPAAVQPERREESRGWKTVEIIGGIRGEVFQVCSVVYGSPDRKTWFFPKGCQHTGVGGILHAALLQFYREHLPPDQLVSVAAAVITVSEASRSFKCKQLGSGSRVGFAIERQVPSMVVLQEI